MSMNVEKLYNGPRTFWWDHTMKYQAPRGDVSRLAGDTTVGSATKGWLCALGIIGIALGLVWFTGRD